MATLYDDYSDVVTPNNRIIKVIIGILDDIPSVDQPLA